MADSHEPVVLELAPLPREQIGPFIILGLEKDADAEQIEAHWAQRVIWARKNLARLPLEDINWAREALGDPERRLRHDAGSLNVDTAEGFLRELAERYGVTTGTARPAWQPLDREKDLRDYVPAVEVPDPAEVRAAIAVPDVPDDMPAAWALLAQSLRRSVRPWDADLLHPCGTTPPLATLGPAHE